MTWNTFGSLKFRAIVWKEWRELFKWGVAALLLNFAVPIVNLLRMVETEEGGGISDLGFFGAAAWLPLVGFVIGLTQVLGESRRGEREHGRSKTDLSHGTSKCSEKGRGFDGEGTGDGPGGTISDARRNAAQGWRQ